MDFLYTHPFVPSFCSPRDQLDRGGYQLALPKTLYEYLQRMENLAGGQHGMAYMGYNVYRYPVGPFKLFENFVKDP